MKQSKEVMNFLRKLRDEEGHTIIIITHEMRIVADYAERTVVLGQGSLLMDDETRTVFSKPETLEKTYVEPPQITQVAQRLSDEGIPDNILTIDELAHEFKQRLG